MNFTKEFKKGDIIEHYSMGQIVMGTVIEVDKHSMVTIHEPIRWGSDNYTKTSFYFNQTQHENGFSGITPKIITKKT